VYVDQIWRYPVKSMIGGAAARPVGVPARDLRARVAARHLRRRLPAAAGVDVGVYATVSAPATVRTGDPVTLLN